MQAAKPLDCKASHLLGASAERSINGPGMCQEQINEPLTNLLAGHLLLLTYVYLAGQSMYHLAQVKMNHFMPG